MNAVKGAATPESIVGFLRADVYYQSLQSACIIGPVHFKKYMLIV